MSELVDILGNVAFWVATLRIATPLILGTLGVLLCERAGVLNLGIEGIMVAGAFTGWLAVYQGLPLWGGDRHFLPLVFDDDPRAFHGVMPYRDGRMLSWTVSRI